MGKYRPWAKAVRVQPRTLEIWDSVRVVGETLQAAISMRGHLTYVNGIAGDRIDLTLPDDVPYRFVALPQYETERVLEGHLRSLGIRVRRGCELLSFDQDADGVTVGQAVAADSLATGPTPGTPAPDAHGLQQDPVAYPIRWHELLRHLDHTLLLWVRDGEQCCPATGVAADVSAARQVGCVASSPSRRTVRCPTPGDHLP